MHAANAEEFMSSYTHYPFSHYFSQSSHRLIVSSSHPPHLDLPSQVKLLLDLLVAVVGSRDRVAHGAGVAEDLIVVAALEGLVAEEVDGLVLDAALLGLVLEVVEAIGLVPASGEDIEGDLATNGEAVS